MCPAYGQVSRALVAPRRPSDPALEQYALFHPATIEINRSPNGTLLFDVQSYPFPLPKWTKGRYPFEAYEIREDLPIYLQ
jgi:hypothetical protein